MAPEFLSVGGVSLLFWQINVSGHKASYRSQIFLVSPSNSYSKKSYQVSEWQEWMNNLKSWTGDVNWSFISCSDVQFYQTLKEKMQYMVFMFRKSICRFFFFIMDQKSKDIQKKKSLSEKNLRDGALIQYKRYFCGHRI